MTLAHMIAIVAILDALAPLARGQQPGSPAGAAPSSMEVGAPEAPVRMRAEDAQHLRSSIATAPPVTPTTPVETGVTRTIELDPPPVVNRSSQFLFRDVTTRPPHDVLSLDLRRAAVEAYRQSRAAPR